jgi:hypothetical protein
VGLLDELDQVPDFSKLSVFRPHLLYGFREAESGVEQQPPGALQAETSMRIEACPRETHGIEAVKLEGIAGRFGIGGHILYHSGTASDEGVAADADELMYRARSPDSSGSSHVHVTAQLYGIRQDYVVFQGAIVAHVRVRHEVATAAHTGAPGCLGAPVQRGILSDHGMVAHQERRGLAPILAILRLGTQHRSYPYLAPLPDHRISSYGSVRKHPGAVAYDYPGSDDGVGSDFHAGP